MLQKRLEALRLYEQTPFPDWGPDLSALRADMNSIKYFVKPKAKESTKWEDLPEDIRKTYERIGIPEAEKKSLSGVGAQYDSEIVYHNLKREWEDKGVIFTNMDVAVQKYPDLVRKHFMTSCVPINDHKFVMLHAAVWSGGTFIYVPKNVTVNVPLQAYFRMNAEYGGQFEHTLIIADEGSEVHYVEGCFTENNIVQTDSGYKKIKHIEEGDRVLTSEGVFMPAKDIQQYPYTGEVYTIQLYGDSTHAIEVTAEHPFLYVDRQRKERRNTTFSPRWNVPPFFKRGGYLALPINQTIVNKKEHTFTVIKGNSKGEYQEWEQNVLLTKEFCRLVGYYLAEGSVSDTQECTRQNTTKT